VALNLRRAIVRNIVISVLIWPIGVLAFTFFNDSMSDVSTFLIWASATGLLVGTFTAIEMSWKIKRGVLSGIPKMMAMRKVDRAEFADVNWTLVDEYGAKLQTFGFKSVGDFTIHAPAPNVRGIAACFVDEANTTIVEVQQFTQTPAPKAMPEGTLDVRISVMAFLAGRALVGVSNRRPTGVDYLLSSPLTVGASYPDLDLPALLEKHAALLIFLKDKTGQIAADDLTVERSFLGSRERLREATKRISGMSGLQIAAVVDKFEAAPKQRLSPSPEVLSALIQRPLSELEQSATAKIYPPIVESRDAAASTDPSVQRLESAEMQRLRPKIESGANWFYWVAGLSFVNAVAALLGSNWSFIIGLGFSQMLTDFARWAVIFDTWSMAIKGMLVLLNLALLSGVGYLGWRARHPNTMLFGIGISLFALDTLLFLISLDWIGVAFHALVLFFMWKGFSAARQFRRREAAI
jgi:hypothetical protein